MVTIVVGPSDSTRRVMADDPASNGGARSGNRADFGDPAPTLALFDSMGRCVAVLACLFTAAAAFAGVPAPVTAATAFLGAVGIIVAQVTVPSVLGTRRRATAIADEVARARSLTEIQAALRAEIATWPKFDLSWCALVPLVPTDEPAGLPPGAAVELQRVLASVEIGDRRPVYVELARGEAVALTCGIESELVLVVASPRRISPAAEDAFGELAAIAGVAARQLDLDAEIADRRHSARFEELVRFSSDVIFIVDAAGTIRYAAPSVTSVLGRWSVDVEGRPLQDLVSPDQAPDVATFLGNVQLLDARNATTIELRFVRGDGTEIPAELTGANLLDNRSVRGIVVTVRDVSSRVELEQQLRHQAFHDGLTGLANRALFRDRLDRAMRVRRDPTDHSPAVAYVDLDDFKAINDGFGHAVGDQVLRSIGERISGCLRAGDTAARLGGDEFALLLENVPDDRALVELVQRVIDAVAAPMTVGNDVVVAVSASAGLATCAEDVTGADDLLRRADMAMYRAKLRGKQQVAHYETEMHDLVHERLQLAAELDEAIGSDALEVHYQPIVDLASEHIVGVEAFVRWRSPSRGLLAPNDFLEIAEDTGLIVPLGAAVLDTALGNVADWRSRGLDDLRLSINVSIRQFLHDDFVESVRAALEAHDVEPRLLVLEITEGVLTADDRAATARLRSLHELGIGLALDDFGTGQSSLRTLQSLPIGQLKIDRSFIAPLREEGSVVAQSIVDLALALGASAVAEGVEHQDEVVALRSLGCRLGQGNHYAPPAPADVVLPLLARDRAEHPVRL